MDMRLEVVLVPVSHIDAARAELTNRGADVSEVFQRRGRGVPPRRDRGTGIRPAQNHQSYGSFASFSDPDGNGWLLQEITTRLPGR